MHLPVSAQNMRCYMPTTVILLVNVCVCRMIQFDRYKLHPLRVLYLMSDMF